MKKFTYAIIAVFITFAALPNPSRATVINVEVEDFEFNPSTFIANVGDTVHWFWTEGFHTTTSFIIPSGAPSWDQPLSSALPFFDYVITVPGSYDYICSPHASMGMTGHFTVLGSTGIDENSSPSLAMISNYVSNGNLYLNYTTPGNTELSLRLYNIVGKQVYEEAIANPSTGLHSNTIHVGTLPKGIYLLSLIAPNAQLTRRIVIE